jgi:hypothetical protein
VLRKDERDELQHEGTRYSPPNHHRDLPLPGVDRSAERSKLRVHLRPHLAHLIAQRLEAPVDPGHRIVNALIGPRHAIQRYAASLPKSTKGRGVEFPAPGHSQAMSFMGRIGKFAKSPEGKKLINQAQQMAKDPETKKKIEDARHRLMKKDKPAAKP